MVALLSSTWGHSVPEICQHGMDKIGVLIKAGRIIPALKVLSLITTLLWHDPSMVSNDETFQSVLKQIIEFDESYYRWAKKLLVGGNRVIAMLQGVIISHIDNWSSFSVSSAWIPALFWLEVLVASPKWMNNNHILSLLEVICRVLRCRYPDHFEKLLTFLKKSSHEICEEEAAINTTKFSLRGLPFISWVLPSNNTYAQPSVSVDLPFLSYTMLRVRILWEDATGMWKNFVQTMRLKSPEDSMKETCEELGMPPTSVASLCLSRLGWHLVSLSPTCPSFLLTLHAFLVRDVSRFNYNENGLLDGNTEFYSGVIGSSFFSKIKNLVTQASDYYEKQLQNEMERVRRDENKDLVLQMNEKCYVQLPLLKEITSRLEMLDGVAQYMALGGLIIQRHINSSYFHPQSGFNPEKLNSLLLGDWNPWGEVISDQQEELWALDLIKEWKNTLNVKSNSSHYSPQRGGSPTLNKTENSVALHALPRAPVYDNDMLKNTNDSSSYSVLPSAPSFSEDDVPSTNNIGIYDMGLPNSYNTMQSYGSNTSYSSAKSLPTVSYENHLAVSSKELLCADIKSTYTISISKRLSEYDSSLPALPLPSPTSLVPAPVLNISKGSSTVEQLQSYLRQLQRHSRGMIDRWREMCSVDCIIRESLPNQYSHAQKRIVRRAPCKPPAHLKVCSIIQ